MAKVISGTTELVKSDDWMTKHVNEIAERNDKELKKHMSKKGALGLPPLLDKRRLEYGIPDEAFDLQPAWDRVLVHQISPWAERAGGEGSLIYRSENAQEREIESCPQGILIAAGFEALDSLYSYGFELGHHVMFTRMAPTHLEMAKIGHQSYEVIAAHAGDLAGSFDLRDAIRKGDVKVEYDAEIQQHVLTDKKGRTWKPKKPFVAADT
jgi:hypothetical protein